MSDQFCVCNLNYIYNYVLHQVPKYLSQQWDKATEKGEVGKITIGKYVPDSVLYPKCDYYNSVNDSESCAANILRREKLEIKLGLPHISLL